MRRREERQILRDAWAGLFPDRKCAGNACHLQRRLVPKVLGSVVMEKSWIGGKPNSNHRVDEEYIYSSQDRAMAVAEGSYTRMLCQHGGLPCTDHPAAGRHPRFSIVVQTMITKGQISVKRLVPDCTRRCVLFYIVRLGSGPISISYNDRGDKGVVWALRNV
jgi:hypothetical protein